MQGLGAAVHLAGDRGLAVGNLELAGKSGLGAVAQRSQHLAGLVAVIVNRLLAQNHQADLLFVHQGLDDFGNRQGLQFIIALHQDGAVRANRHGGAQGFAAGRRAAGDGDHFAGHAFFLEAHRLFDGDFVKRVHAHLDVGDIDAAAVTLDADFDVVVHHALDNFQLLQRSGILCGRPLLARRRSRQVPGPA